MVSVIIPVLNEERYMDECIASLIKQDYPKDDMEWIFVDGNSSDKTKDIILSYQTQYPNLIKIADNPKKTQANALNIGILMSSGLFIVRLDAHANYQQDYISKCIYYLNQTDADNVGGIIVTKAKKENAMYIAKILSSKFGVGNSKFRTNGFGLVDTVPFGAFKREAFIKNGLFDTRLDRNEDNEFNYRIRKNGGKVMLVLDICSVYYCRDNLKDLLRMARSNGKWNIITFKACPGSMRVRHFAPFLFFLSILVFACVGFAFYPFWFASLALFLSYFFVDIIVSALISKRIGEFFKLLISFFLFHLNYAFGSCVGLFKMFDKRYSKKNYKIEYLER